MINCLLCEVPTMKMSIHVAVFEPGLHEVDYEYGQVGHSIPFKGVGPLALTVLKGMCNTYYLVSQLSFLYKFEENF